MQYIIKVTVILYQWQLKKKKKKNLVEIEPVTYD